MSDVRLFVALEVPAVVRRALAEWAVAATGHDAALRLTGEDSMHLTLAFLGHRPHDEVEELGRAVHRCAASFGGDVALCTGPAVWFDPRRPRVLTVLLDDGTDGLAVLHDALWDDLAALGHARERRRFRPHVTVARVRHGARPAALDLPPAPALSFTATHVALFRSHLGRGPARYEVLERARIGGLH
jgi:2'-5' RNA ligase